ncbi:hypothetical protein, partial [Parendozoicomonas sp. Alg238-R29]|uniref:hypothetical protein n=1 Tax=Parendozoicomonas sp. Alg238-R29 TaxID=2993446 RepID=UPI00248EADFF
MASPPLSPQNRQSSSLTTAAATTSTQSSDTSPVSVWDRTVQIKSEFNYAHYEHTWSNKAPLYQEAEKLTKKPHYTDGLACNWNFQREQYEVDLRPQIRREVKDYMGLSDSSREQYLNDRMHYRKYSGDEFPALKGENEAYAKRFIKEFEILGHYAGEVHNDESLKTLAAKYGYKTISKYLIDTKDGFCISSLKDGNICSLINACTLHVADLDKTNPAVAKLPVHSLEPNVAFMPVRFQGKVATMLISTTAIKQGESLWTDYGPGY